MSYSKLHEYNKHKALSYKMQRDLWRRRAEIYEESYKELADKRSLTDISVDIMIDAGLVQKNTLVKILGDGELKTKLNVKAHAFSKTAVEAIEALKGTAEKI